MSTRAELEELCNAFLCACAGLSWQCLKYINTVRVNVGVYGGSSPYSEKILIWNYFNHLEKHLCMFLNDFYESYNQKQNYSQIPQRCWNTYFDDNSYFLPRQTPVSVSVINFKRPFQLVFKFSTKNEVHSCYILHEVNFTILKGKWENKFCGSVMMKLTRNSSQDSFTLFVSNDWNTFCTYANSSSVELLLTPKIFLNSWRCRFPLGHSVANFW